MQERRRLVGPHAGAKNVGVVVEQRFLATGGRSNSQPDAAAVQADLLAKHTDLEQAYRDLFSGHPIEDRYAIQADGERLGAATWRAFARDADRDEERVVFLGCAELEEASAAVLEALIAAASE